MKFVWIAYTAAQPHTRPQQPKVQQWQLGESRELGQAQALWCGVTTATQGP